MKEYIDASLFLGMHSADEKTRVACKNYFVTRLNDQVGMSLEQVGKCDEVIWQYQRDEQDAYYPFMDNLHTIMDIQRKGYHEKDIQEATTNPDLQDLSIANRLTLGMVISRGAELYSVNPELAEKDYVRSPETGEELSFPQPLEEMYQQSLEVRVCTQE
ncbi:hypothetical protein CL619_00700 [archaeon]|nr:hypothetical protein [archaeon]|tara:strand:- start:1683 stop:2159 length:477 start_codon:yes stop_codon:yes gene_type:complete